MLALFSFSRAPQRLSDLRSTDRQRDSIAAVVRSRHGPTGGEKVTTVVGARPEVFHASCQWPITCAFEGQRLVHTGGDDDDVHEYPPQCYGKKRGEGEEGGGGVKEGTEAKRTEKRVCAMGPCRRQSAGTTRSSSLRGDKGVTSARCHTKGLGRGHGGGTGGGRDRGRGRGGRS